MKFFKRVLNFINDRLDEPAPTKTHWSDVWLTMEFRIKKVTSDNKDVYYYPEYRVDQLSKWKMVGVLPTKKYKDALRRIEDYKNMYRSAWNKEYTSKTEYITIKK